MRDTALTAPTLDAIRPTRPSAKPRTGATTAAPRRKRAGKRRLPARLSVIAGSAGFCAIMIGIVANATLFQKGHHPAPLFAAAPAKPAVVEPPPVVAALPPAPPVAPLAPAVPAISPGRPPVAAVAAAPTKAAPKPATKTVTARRGDAIARLLGTLQPSSHLHAAAPARTALARSAAPLAN